MELLKELETKKEEILRYLKNQLSGIRGGRPTTKLVESIIVDYVGQKLKIVQLGSLSVNLPREIVISVWDGAAVGSVAKAVESALHVQPVTEGNMVRVSLPPLSEERRREFSKIVKQEAEETRIKLRTLRDDCMKKLKKQEEEKKMSEDEKFKLKGKIEESIKKANQDIDALLDQKVKEINE